MRDLSVVKYGPVNLSSQQGKCVAVKRHFHANTVEFALFLFRLVYSQVHISIRITVNPWSESTAQSDSVCAKAITETTARLRKRLNFIGNLVALQKENIYSEHGIRFEEVNEVRKKINVVVTVYRKDSFALHPVFYFRRPECSCK